MSTPSDAASPVRRHRRDVWLQIVAPIAAAAVVLLAVCVALIVGVATGSLEAKQITVVMGIVFTVFIAIPLSILCLVPYFVLVVGVHLTAKGHARTATPLRLARRLTANLATQTHRHAPRLAQPLAGMSVRLARWEHTLRAWLGAAMPVERKKDHE